MLATGDVGDDGFEAGFGSVSNGHDVVRIKLAANDLAADWEKFGEALERAINRRQNEIIFCFVQDYRAFDEIFAIAGAALPAQEQIPIDPGAGTGVNVGEKLAEIEIGVVLPIAFVVRRVSAAHFRAKHQDVWVFLAYLPHLIRKDAIVPVIAEAGNLLGVAKCSSKFAAEELVGDFGEMLFVVIPEKNLYVEVVKFVGEVFVGEFALGTTREEA